MKISMTKIKIKLNLNWVEKNGVDIINIKVYQKAVMKIIIIIDDSIEDSKKIID